MSFQILKQFFILFTLIILLSLNVSAATDIEAKKIESCVSIEHYEAVATNAASLGVMIVGFSAILLSIRLQNYHLILIGIITAILGFASLLFGNYMYASLLNALC